MKGSDVASRILISTRQDDADKDRGEHLKTSSTIIISADTIVDFNGEIFEKPLDFQDAYSMLLSLSGKVSFDLGNMP